MAEAEFPAAAAGTRLIDAALGVLFCNPCHHIRRHPALPDELDHDVEDGACMGEEQFQPWTEIVLGGLARSRQSETILGATAIASVANLATPTLRRQRVKLVLAEFALLFRSDKSQHMCLVNVSKFELRLDEMVTGIHVAVML